MTRISENVAATSKHLQNYYQQQNTHSIKIIEMSY